LNAAQVNVRAQKPRNDVITALPDNANQWNLWPHTEPFCGGNSDDCTVSESGKEKYSMTVTMESNISTLAHTHLGFNFAEEIWIRIQSSNSNS